MKYLSGGSLADRLANGPLRFDQAVPILIQVCASLQTAHARGLVHRDLKPANLLFDAADQAVISDFGLARAFAVSSSSSSSAGVAGTPFYRAPELWRGNIPAGPAADVYSLGCVLVEMLTGLSPFRGDTPDKVLTRHLIDGPDFGPAWPPPGAPLELAALITQALEKDPARRFADAATLAEALQALGSAPATPTRAKRRSTVAVPAQLPPDLKVEISNEPLPISSPVDLKIANVYEDGLSAFYLEDWDQARDCFEIVLKANPGYRDAPVRLNQARQQIDLAQRYRQALELLGRADWPGAAQIWRS